MPTGPFNGMASAANESRDPVEYPGYPAAQPDYGVHPGGYGGQSDNYPSQPDYGGRGSGNSDTGAYPTRPGPYEPPSYGYGSGGYPAQPGPYQQQSHDYGSGSYPTQPAPYQQPSYDYGSGSYPSQAAPYQQQGYDHSDRGYQSRPRYPEQPRRYRDDEDEDWEPRKRGLGGGAIAAIVVAGLAIGGTAAYLLTRDDGTPQTQTPPAGQTSTPTATAEPTPTERAQFLVDIFANAPGYAQPGTGAQTGTLSKGTHPVYCKVWGPSVGRSATVYNHWWLLTDLDSGSTRNDQYISAYYLTRWGNDEAKDNSGNEIPDC